MLSRLAATDHRQECLCYVFFFFPKRCPSPFNYAGVPRLNYAGVPRLRGSQPDALQGSGATNQIKHRQSEYAQVLKPGRERPLSLPRKRGTPA